MDSVFNIIYKDRYFYGEMGNTSEKYHKLHEYTIKNNY